ncbi:MAG: putative heavy-metal-binding-domain-containing protein [Podila humilis]|nr:MAG: putative heavy-metal-binding-domain-containing protein [Podila humilis]
MSASAQPVRSVDRRFTTTAFEYPGYFIAQAHGVVRGITVRNPNAGKAILGAFASFTGGESSTYIEMAEKARERAFLRMLEHAAAAGGNAVIGVQFTGQEILERMTEVMAYGTSVTLVPLQQQQPPQQPVYSPMSSPYQPQQIPQSQPYNPAQPQSYNPAQPVFAAPAPPAKQ